MLAGMALTYTACKKSSSSSTTVDAKTVSSQVALNLSQSLYSGFGGFSLTSGLSAPGQFGVDRNALRLKLTKGRTGINDVNDDITCGMHTDTTFSTTITTDGGQGGVAGSIGFTFNCTNGVFSGFNVTDNLKVTLASAQLTGTFNVSENLTLAQVTAGDDNSNISMNGSLSFGENAKVSGKTTNISFSYTFTNIILDQEGTIVSGSATFNTTGTNAQGTWNYNGTATFLGNQTVKIVINGATYTANLQTGTVS
jgi:hypothetical protein